MRACWRDGLADETVVRNIEDIRSYRAFERALVGSVDPRSVIELVLAHRLASLLWRLRRAIAIETGLFELQAEFLLAHQEDPSRGPGQSRSLETFTQTNSHKIAAEPLSLSVPPPPLALRSKSHVIAQCYLRLSHLEATLLDRAGSYEASLWRQAAQTIWALEERRRPPWAPTQRRFRRPVRISYWDAAR